MHHGNKISVPIYMQNRSMTVMGHIRVISAAVDGGFPPIVRAVRANVAEELVQSSIGWSVNNMCYIVGRHMGDSFQDPTLAFPALSGPQCRTTFGQG